MKKNKRFLDIILRYFSLLLLTIFGVELFQFLFKPLTKYPVFWLFDLFYNVELNNFIYFQQGPSIGIIGACIAGSAYLLLLILNFSTPNINFFKRMKLLLIGFGSFLILNIIRIFILGILIVNQSSSFAFVHKFFWYFLSIFFVIAIWFFETKRFNIKKIPFYSDIKKVLKEIKK